MDINYAGELIWPGWLGNFFIVLAFAAAICSTVAFFMAYRKQDAGWKKIGRMSFVIHTVATLGTIFCLFYLLVNHRYEYQYVWKHLNNEMPAKYIISCFWGGQEGSILLWSFWHVVLGMVLMYTSKKWETRVMTVFAGVQVFVASLLIGAYFGDYQFGSNPFTLLRLSPENIGLPWTMNPEYLSLAIFQDGRGLNPLLQNYWMTIHPPTTFLGFASTLVPFAFAVAGLWTRDDKGWMKPAIPWSFFGVMVLGTGILMGGAWAYEALSFGGFWAWDPVENAVLVPWLTFVGGAHLLLINQRKGKSVFSAYLFIIITFIFILYSTFLTRSGILGDTSVHSFVDSGILPQLLIYLLFFTAVCVFLLLRKKKDRAFYGISSLALFFIGTILYATDVMQHPQVWVVLFLVSSTAFAFRAYYAHYRQKDEEELWSREFWMFVGSLVLLLSSLHVIFNSSYPVLNELLLPFEGMFQSLYESTGESSTFLKKLSKRSFALNTDRIQFYNQWQVPFAVIITLMMAVTQFFRYGKTDLKKWGKKIAASVIIALAITLLIGFGTSFRDSSLPILALLFTGIFSVTANLDYLIRIIKGKLDFAGSSIAHVGFALVLLGALISTSQSDKISENQMGNIRDLSEDFKNQEDMLLMKNDTILMGDYMVKYYDRFQDGSLMKFAIQYYDKLPFTYEKGDVVFHRDMFFEAKEKHEAGNNFLEGMEERWALLPTPTRTQLDKARLWKPAVAGEEAFVLEPRVRLSEKFENSPEPDTKHFLGKDIYTHIKYGRTEEPEIDENGYLEPEAFEVQIGDTINSSGTFIYVTSASKVPNPEDYLLFADDEVLGLNLRIAAEDSDTTAKVLFIIRDDIIVPDETEIEKYGLKFKLLSIDPAKETFELAVWDHSRNMRDFIVMQAIVFPQINILWIGCLIMILGTLLAIRHRIRERKRLVKKNPAA